MFFIECAQEGDMQDSEMRKKRMCALQKLVWDEITCYECEEQETATESSYAKVVL